MYCGTAADAVRVDHRAVDLEAEVRDRVAVVVRRVPHHVDRRVAREAVEGRLDLEGRVRLERRRARRRDGGRRQPRRALVVERLDRHRVVEAGDERRHRRRDVIGGAARGGFSRVPVCCGTSCRVLCRHGGMQSSSPESVFAVVSVSQSQTHACTL